MDGVALVSVAVTVVVEVPNLNPPEVTGVPDVADPNLNPVWLLLVDDGVPNVKVVPLVPFGLVSAVETAVWPNVKPTLPDFDVKGLEPATLPTKRKSRQYRVKRIGFLYFYLRKSF